jgi:hypothetical protein
LLLLQPGFLQVQVIRITSSCVQQQEQQQQQQQQPQQPAEQLLQLLNEASAANQNCRCKQQAATADNCCTFYVLSRVVLQ